MKLLAVLICSFFAFPVAGMVVLGMVIVLASWFCPRKEIHGND